MNNAFEDLLSNGDDDDKFLAGLLYPPTGPSAAEREAIEAERQAEMRRRQREIQAEEAEEEAGGIYRAPFPRFKDESDYDYARRLAEAATEDDRGKLSQCIQKKCKHPLFRIGKGCRGPVLCSERCLNRVRKYA